MLVPVLVLAIAGGTFARSLPPPGPGSELARPPGLAPPNSEAGPHRWRRRRSITPTVERSPQPGDSAEEGDAPGVCSATTQCEDGAKTLSPNRAKLVQQLVAVGVKHGELFGTRRNRRREWEAGINNVYRDLAWSVSIDIGTPPQTLNVSVDTGSTTLWIYTGCEAHVCTNVTVFDSTKSSTFNSNNNKPFVQNYGIGGVDGTYGHDVVAIGGVAVPDQQFGLVTYNETDGMGAMKGSTKSGLLGLGWPADGVGKDPRSWWAESVQANEWPEPMFGIHLGRELDHSLTHFEVPGGHITLGGLDRNLYVGEVHYVDVVRDSTVYWQVPLDAVTVNDVVIDAKRGDGSKPLAIIDTGTTVALGARDVVAQIYSHIPGAAIDPEVTFSMLGYDADIYTFPCKSISGLPRISMRMGGVDWPIYPPDLVVSINGTQCTGALLGLDSPTDIWLLGGTFLKNVYSVYRYDPPSVGFATVSPPNDARYSTDDISVLDGSNMIYFDSSTDRGTKHLTSGSGKPTSGAQQAGEAPKPAITDLASTAMTRARHPVASHSKQPALLILLLAAATWTAAVLT